MDLSEIKVVEKDVKIVHPSNKAFTGLTVTLMSPNDERLDKLRNQITQQQISQQAKNKTPKVEELKANRRKILFAAMTKWDWGIGDDGEQVLWFGEKPELNPRVWGEIYDSASWIVDQIDTEFGELESFFQTAGPA